MTTSPDGKVVIAQHGDFNPHGLMVIDTKTEEPVQRVKAYSGVRLRTGPISNS